MTNEHQNERQMVDGLLDAIPVPTAGALAQLHARLEDAAERAGLLDVSYRTVASPVGSLLLASTPLGLVRIAFEREDHDAVLAHLAREISPRVLRSPQRLDEAARQLDEYFTRGRHQFDLPIDLQLAHGFRHTVLMHLREIAYGTTASYATVAAAAGNPGAARAVGSACATNPLPVVVPCHRVVRGDGSIGQYLGGTAAKRALLAIEATA
jgi:methylated-DNA-[protein]-cysteine S-methyltransferase